MMPGLVRGTSVSSLYGVERLGGLEPSDSTCAVNSKIHFSFGTYNKIGGLEVAFFLFVETAQKVSCVTQVKIAADLEGQILFIDHFAGVVIVSD